MNPREVQQFGLTVIDNVERVIVGKREAIELVIVGHQRAVAARTRDVDLEDALVLGDGALGEGAVAGLFDDGGHGLR